MCEIAEQLKDLIMPKTALLASVYPVVRPIERHELLRVLIQVKHVHFVAEHLERHEPRVLPVLA